MCMYQTKIIIKWERGTGSRTGHEIFCSLAQKHLNNTPLSPFSNFKVLIQKKNYIVTP